MTKTRLSKVGFVLECEIDKPLPSLLNILMDSLEEAGYKTDLVQNPRAMDVAFVIKVFMEKKK